MSSQPAHCPFLNRSDDRCSDAFNLEHLNHAFHFCFGRYKACPQYLELLVERRLRRQTAGQTDVQAPALVQVTISPAIGNRISKLAADDPIIPGLSRV